MIEEKKKSVRVNITMPADTLEEMDTEIDALGMTRSTYIAMAVRSRLNSDKMIRDMPSLMAQAAEMMKFMKDMDSRGLLPGQTGMDKK